MNGERGHFLSRAAFSEDQHGHIGGGDFADRAKDLLHGRAVAEHAFEAVTAQPALHLPVLSFEAGDMESPFENGLQLLHLNRFAKEIVSPLPDGPQGVVLLGLAAGDDDFDERILGQQLGQGRQAFIGSARGGRQTEVQNDNRRPMVVECAGRAWPILGQQHLIITRQRPFHLGANLLVIIDNQQFRLHAPEVCSGNNTRKVVPFPFSLSTSILPRWALTIILR